MNNAVANKMKINQKQTKLMYFNPGMRDFNLDNEIELVEETTLLGVVLRSDLIHIKLLKGSAKYYGVSED